MTRILLTFGLILSWTASAFAEEGSAEDEPSILHLDLDAAVRRAGIQFFSASDVSPICLDGNPVETCTPIEFSAWLLTGRVGLGFQNFTLEASMTKSVQAAFEYFAWSAGVRLDTSYQAIISMFFRGAIVQRFGDLEGVGGLLGAGIQVRATHWLVPYVEAEIEATSVPEAIFDAGTLFSWSTRLGFGLRMSFTPW